MSYRVELADKAKDELSKLPKNVQQKLLDRITNLATEPHPTGSIRIKARKDCYRFRMGDYRVLYTVFEDYVVVLVLRIGHRREVYDHVESVETIIERFRASQE